MNHDVTCPVCNEEVSAYVMWAHLDSHGLITVANALSEPYYKCICGDNVRRISAHLISMPDPSAHLKEHYENNLILNALAPE